MKLTPHYIKRQVASDRYAFDGTLTICTITTRAGFRVVGTSRYLNPNCYDTDVGEKAVI